MKLKMPLTRAKARANRGKAPIEESVDQTRGEASKRTYRAKSEERSSRTRPRREESPKPQAEINIEERIAATIEKAM